MPVTLAVRIGPVKDPENYEVLETEGLKVYYKGRVSNLYSVVEVELAQFLFIPMLLATGKR